METTIMSPLLDGGTMSYKLYIPAEVEKKIKYICGQISTIEWSGTLFYTTEGTFEDNNLVIKCVDLFVMDIGTAAYTEFDMSPDVLSYMMEHDLLDCHMGLIHSHNSMATFFSGTDTQTLREEGNRRNHFLSLIVNNNGPYTARITRKIKAKDEIKRVYTYETFGGSVIEAEDIIEEDVNGIEYFNLTIEIEAYEKESYNEIYDRLQEIKKAKAKPTGYQSSNLPKIPTVHKEQELPFYMEEHKGITTSASTISTNVSDLPFSYEDFPISGSVIQRAVEQLVTGSIIIPIKATIDLKKWCDNMETLFDKRFGEGPLATANFKQWAEAFIEFICTTTEDPDYADIFTEDEMTALCSYYIKRALEKLPKNKYIDFYLKTINLYII